MGTNGKNMEKSPAGKSFRIGLVGYRGIGKLHAANWRNLNLYYPDLPARIVLQGAASQSLSSADLAVSEGGFSYGTTDYRELINDPEIDLIDICTPNDTHHEILLAAVEAGKHIYCEKPLALTLEQAEEMTKAAEKSPGIVQMAFTYRFIPAVQKARQLIQEGLIGEVLDFTSQYYHTGYLNPKRPMSWRLAKERSGGGALVDLGSHVIDLMLYLTGPFNRVLAQTRTFVDQRPAEAGSQELIDVLVDDHAQLLISSRAGGVGSIQVSRIAHGTTDDLTFEIYGTQGALRFHSMDPANLEVFDSRDESKGVGDMAGFKGIQTLHKYQGNKVPGGRNLVNAMSMHADSQYQAIRAAVGLQAPEPDIQAGLRVQQVLAACYQSVEDDGWVSLP